MLWSYRTESGYTGTVKAMDAEDAAEYAWKELCDGDPDFYHGGEIEVWVDGDPSTAKKFDVEVESVPHFIATEKES